MNEWCNSLEVGMAPRKKNQSSKKSSMEEPVEERAGDGRDETAAANTTMEGEEMGAWDDDDEMEEEPRMKKGRKSRTKTADEEDEEIRAMVDRPRLTVESALTQLRMEEMGIREFIDELKSKKRHLLVEEERLRLALNKKMAQEMTYKTGRRF